VNPNSAKIRRMSKRRQKIARRRIIRKILRANLQTFIGRQVGRDTMAAMILAMAGAFQQMAAELVPVRFFVADGGHRLDALVSMPRPVEQIMIKTTIQ
jgi:hypothetical protein